MLLCWRSSTEKISILRIPVQSRNIPFLVSDLGCIGQYIVVKREVMCNGGNRNCMLHFNINLIVFSFSFRLSCLQLLYFQLKISNVYDNSCIALQYGTKVSLVTVMHNKHVILFNCKIYIFKTNTKRYGIVLYKCLHGYTCTCHQVKTVNRVISAFML
jgi:hypothetical protein